MNNISDALVSENFNTESYFKILWIVANADGNMHEFEESYLYDQAKVFNYDLSSIKNMNLQLSDIDFENTSELTKRIIIRDCISLAYIDGKYDTTEKEKIFQLTEKLDVSPDIAAELEKWLVDYWAIMETGNTILTAN